MINDGEQLSFQATLDSYNTCQESLQRQLDQLDITQPGDCVLGDFLSKLYQPEIYQRLDQDYSALKAATYQPRAALLGKKTYGTLGCFIGIYEYKPITEAVKNVNDYFHIFPDIEKMFQADQKDDIHLTIKKIAEIITKKTDIPVVFSRPINNSYANDWTMLPDGNIVDSHISKENQFGLRSYIYHGTPEIYSDLVTNGYTKSTDFYPIGDAIIINENQLENPTTIPTCLHELGHIAEDRFVIPQKEKEFPNQTILRTEVLSSLYGLKTALLLAKNNPDSSYKAIQRPISLYNWSLTGTVAP